MTYRKPSKTLPSAIALTALLVTACATSPLGRNQLMLLSGQQLNAMGIQAFEQKKSSTPVDRSAAVNHYVECVARQLLGAQAGQWEIRVFDDPTPNAFALPGGKIGVHKGLLKVAQNQHQLATVLGHEIAHVQANHANERASQEFAMQQGINLLAAAGDPSSQAGRTVLGVLGLGAKYGVLMPYNRLQESEADLVGLDTMAQAGFDPAQSINLWINMDKAGGAQPVEFLSTHPSHGTRIQALQQRLPQATALQQQALAAGRRPNCDQ
ncbi:M48 family metallopeptidase [Methylogaea oryzae]|uniref:Zn-dependent protease n=1 Tax=Methylogaea oryzae TaxID=1295382 RepID=A0A8D4VRD9_9GAMM|nr:M48 family metallopeptidase [Methylogaea oryzae]BBL71904.1 Zn-dependent protease [Methylogaea oryzae]